MIIIFQYSNFSAMEYIILNYIATIPTMAIVCTNSPSNKLTSKLPNIKMT